MVLLFTFYTNKSQYFHYLNSKKNPNSILIGHKEKLYLHSVLVYHKLWRNQEFWEAAIFGSILDEIKNSNKNTFFTFQEKMVERTIREKNLVFSQLIAYSYNMQMFELTGHFVKDIVEKYAMYFNLFDLQIEDLKVFVLFIK